MRGEPLTPVVEWRERGHRLLTVHDFLGRASAVSSQLASLSDPETVAAGPSH